MISQQQWLFDGGRDLQCIHLRPGLRGEKQHPHAEERSPGKNFIPDQTTAVETTPRRAWSRCRTPAAETLQCFRRRLLVGLVANIGRGKDGSDRRTGYPPQCETFVFVWCALGLCTFSLFHACFLAFGAADRSCPYGHAVHVSRQCGCHEGLKPRVDTPWWGSWWSRPRHRRSTKNVKSDHKPLIKKKKTRC